MKKVAIIGAFGKGQNLLNGQTVKTKIVTAEIEHQLGLSEVISIDLFGRLNNVLCMIRSICALVKCKNLIIMPAQNALKVLAPWVSMWNSLFHRRLHYVVIGGWLPEYLDKHSVTLKSLCCFDGIYVETAIMKRVLEKRGLNNVYVLPNCKNLQITNIEETTNIQEEPFTLVTFSRVMKEKGIEDAICATELANKKIGKPVFKLEIYGQVDGEQTQWFEEISTKYKLDSSNSCCRYMGKVPYDKSTEVLYKSYALLFPTYYEGEGFAGTIIDAYAAGIPVIASDWRYNTETVIDGVTGKVYPTHDTEAFTNAIVWAYEHQSEWNGLKAKCIQEAEKYLPKNVVTSLIKALN